MARGWTKKYDGRVGMGVDIAVKVKEPLEPKFFLMRPGQVLFTFSHNDEELGERSK